MTLEELNQKIRNCKKCRLHKTRKHALIGEGNPEARLFLIPQAPGEMEDEQDAMFVGPSGQIFRELIHKAGLSWNDFYISNLIKCILPGCRKPKQDEIESCSEYLMQEIEITDPDILVPLGYYSTKFIFDEYGIISDLPKNQFSDHIAELKLADNIKVFPLSHPATPLYQPELQEDLEASYARLKILKKQCKWYPVCPMRRYTEQGRLDKKWSELYCKGDWQKCQRYKLEESGHYHPDYLLPDGSEADHLKP